ncbi:MAG: LLM class F420-dependent oxidoreductase [Gammaproteobacteria bacterium]|nr:LLM class F420-dependent oxidoreductase [Gammaproteobacteria bacterium]|tara:strand:+ start:58 stop:942 length:885 start_codon:yes stop_codon:yes gene_type:complete
MKIGAVFPHLEIGVDPAVIKDWAQTAEGLGYSHLLIYDHVLGAVHEGRNPPLWGPYTQESAFHELFVLLGFFSACTERVGLASGVLILPQRQTALVAKQATEVDILSDGRLRLGVGTGWNYVEYESLNEDFSNRGQRQVEQIGLLRKLWSEDVIDFDTSCHRIDRAGLNPLPGREIPIWLGGFKDVVFRRAAEIGDGFIFGSGQKENLAGMIRLKKFLDEFGRGTEGFGVEALLNFQSGPEQWRAEVEDWVEAGASHVAMRGMALRGQGSGLASPRKHIEILETYWKEVGDLSD